MSTANKPRERASKLKELEAQLGDLAPLVRRFAPRESSSCFSSPEVASFLLFFQFGVFAAEEEGDQTVCTHNFVVSILFLADSIFLCLSISQKITESGLLTNPETLVPTLSLHETR